MCSFFAFYSGGFSAVVIAAIAGGVIVCFIIVFILGVVWGRRRQPLPTTGNKCYY